MRTVTNRDTQVSKTSSSAVGGTLGTLLLLASTCCCSRNPRRILPLALLSAPLFLALPVLFAETFPAFAFWTHAAASTPPPCLFEGSAARLVLAQPKPSRAYRFCAAAHQ